MMMKRARPTAEKAAVVAGVRKDVWPVIDTDLPMPEAARAHRIMASSEHIGKIMLLTGLGAVED
jgi:NADPH:quinone reductase-like Zn-dependent oxidoreductase